MKDFEKLYYLHKEELYRYLFGLTHDPEQAGDLMQETFLQAMRLMGVTPEQTLVVEDGKPGIQAAAAAHADCLIVDRGTFVKLVQA